MLFLAIKEFFELFFIRVVVQKRNLLEFFKVIYRYYCDTAFLKSDFSLLLTYFFHSPFKISQRFLKQKGEKNIHVYGETPLTTMDLIARECHISSSDTLFELGCGRGRDCFWLNHFIKCKVVGIEHIPQFIERANRIKKKYKLHGVDFRYEDIREADYSGATILYLYGSCFEEEFIQQLIHHFRSLPTGTKIITVSYPLTDYADDLFKLKKQFIAPYTWGEAEVYLQTVVHPKSM